MFRSVVAFAAILACSSARAHDPELKWLDREFGHFLLAPHSLSGRPTPIHLSDQFRDHIFLVDRTRRKPNSPTWRFMTTDFVQRLRSYEKANGTGGLTAELRRVLAEVGYPFDLSAEELRDFRENPRRKRFAPVRLLADGSISAGRMQMDEMYFVCDVIKQIRDEADFFKRISIQNTGNLKARIDRLLNADGDAEFCVLDRGDATRVSREKLEREGFRLKVGNRRSGK